jgi:hypothetical protein
VVVKQNCCTKLVIWTCIPWAEEWSISTFIVSGFQKTTIQAYIATSTLLTNYQDFNCSLCMHATFARDNLVSRRPQTSIFLPFMRLATSCCLRGLLSPLTFQQYTIMGGEGWEEPHHCQKIYWNSFGPSSCEHTWTRTIGSLVESNVNRDSRSFPLGRKLRRQITFNRQKFWWLLLVTSVISPFTNSLPLF